MDVRVCCCRAGVNPPESCPHDASPGTGRVSSPGIPSVCLVSDARLSDDRSPVLAHYRCWTAHERTVACAQKGYFRTNRCWARTGWSSAHQAILPTILSLHGGGCPGVCGL